MDRIETQSTSRKTATTSDIVLREGPQTKLLFRPEIVDNTGRPEAAVRGRFLYQKKAQGPMDRVRPIAPHLSQGR
jgi:hypothetical protein